MAILLTGTTIGGNIALHAGNVSTYALTSITSANVTTALGYTPVTSVRTITINGTALDLSANRTFTISTITGNAGTATTFSTGRTDYKGVTDGAVSGQLMWKNYGNNHTIFDASNSTNPQGGAISNTNSSVAWSATYPTLMGWNGSSTYGVRVDSARIADIATTATTATTLQTARTISLGTSVTSTATSFNGSANITIPITGVSEAYLTWGGRNLAGNYGPIDAALMPDLGANRLAFTAVSAVTIEYSRDGGATWIDYGASDAVKTNLLNGNYSGIQVGGGGYPAGTDYTSYRVRVTINTSGQIYTILNKFIILVSTNGSTGTYCTIDARTQTNFLNAVDTWTVFSNQTPVTGWSGYNVINLSGLVTFGNTPASQYGQVRLTFGQTGYNTTYTGLTIQKILGFGGVGWQTPSTLAATGQIYTYDHLKNVGFPATVTATTFSGALSGNSTTATTLQTARTINGTSFNGSASIDTSYWGTSRTLTIGNTGKSVNGSANVSWTLAEIGAQAAGSYLTAESDTLATVTGRGATTASQVSFTKTDDHAISVGTIRGRAVGVQTGEFIQLYERVNIGGPSGWGAANTAAPSYGLSVYGGATIGYGNSGGLTVTGTLSATNFSGTSSGTNTGDQTTISGNAGSATVLQTARTLTIGATGKSFNGSANISWTLTEIGAQPAGSYAAASHTHAISEVTGLQTALDGKQPSGSYAAASHNHTTLTGVTSIGFAAEASDLASISTTINGSGTYFDFNLTDDNNNDWWRWRFTPSGSTVYDAMTLKPLSNGNADLTISGSVFADNLAISNWDTAFGWGNHASIGYLTSSSLSGYATQTYVNTAISNLVNSAPAALDTLNELAAALGNDSSFSTTITNSIATKAPLASPALTGTPTAPTAATSTNTTQIATTAFVKAQGYSTTTGTVTSVSGTGSYGGLTLSGTVTSSGNITLGGTPTGTWPISVSGNATTATTAGALSSMNISQFTNNSGYIIEGGISFSGEYPMMVRTSANTAYSHVGIKFRGSDSALIVVGTVTASGGNSTNWNTAYSWGNHASAGYLTSITSGNVTTALGYTPYNATNPNGYITGISFANVSSKPTTISGYGITDAITTGNIGSQSVSYAATAGSAPNGSNINQFYNVNSGDGNGLRFWGGSDSYKISMGVGALYQYGPVTDYSIKMQMNDSSTDRGFTWGRISYAPIAALNSTSGDLQIAGSLRAAGHLFTSYNGSNILLKSADNTGDAGILLQNSGGSFKFQIYGNGTDYGFLNGNWASWDIRKTISGAMYMNSDSAYYLYTNGTSNFYALNIQGNAVVHAGNIGSQSVSNANTVGGYAAAQTYTATGNAAGSYLGGHYSSGGTEKPNSATFGAGKLKLAMLSGGNLGFGGSWNDVLWLSGYNGGDVKSSHALVFDKYSTNVWVSDQNFDSATWGTGYLLLSTANYNSYSPTLTGTGASGSWGISVTGSAGSVAWTNVSSRPTALSQFTNDLGNYGGFLTSITAHTHAISDVTGLQTALDGKQAAGSYSLTSHTHADATTSVAGFMSAADKTKLNGIASGATANAGTVTSVSGTGTVSGLTLSGTVTSSGSLTLGGTLSLTSANVTTALGFTPYNATNPSGYITSSGSISGSAGSVTGLTLNSSANGINPDSVTQNQIGYNTSVSLFGQSDGGLYSSAYSSSWIHQIYGDFRTGQIAIRGKNNGTWQAWRTVLDSSNFSTWAAAASHTHTIANITGLQTALDGKQVAGSYAAASHTHTIANVTGLQTALDGKAASSHTHAISDVTGLQTALDGKQASGSYLTTSGKAADSDLLDGLDLHTGRNNEVNKVVRTDVSGYIQAGWINTTSGNTTSTLTDIYVNTNDGYIRKATPAHFRSQITDGVYAPVSHTHTIANVTGLQTALDGKAASSHTHTIANVTGLQTALDGKQASGSYLTTSGKAADSELIDGIDSSRIVYGDGSRGKSISRAGASANASDSTNASGFYFGNNVTGLPTTDYWNWVTVAANSWSGSDGYQFQLAGSFWTDDYRIRRMTSGTNHGWVSLIHSGNIGSQSVSYASTAGSATSATTATTATIATQLNKFGDIYGQDWNTYYVNGKMIVSSVYGGSGPNFPTGAYNYGAMLSYGVTGSDFFQVYFPENGALQGGAFRKLHYRTGWNGSWSAWKSVVDQEGQVCTIAGSNQTGIEIHSNVGYNQDPLTYFLIRGQADTSWKALKVRLTGDAGGQDIEFRRIAENGTDARMWYIPRGANTVNFDYPIVQPSDSRLKDNITPISTPVDKIKSLRGVEFDWNSGEQVGTHDVGLIAQDVEAVLPEAVTTQEDGYKNLAYTKVIPLLVEAMKEQQALIEALKAEIELLKNK